MANPPAMDADDLFKQGLMNFPNISSENPCQGINCGEGGCLVDNKQPKCICPFTGKEPDAFLKCNRSIFFPVDTGGKVREPEDIPMFGPPIETEERNSTRVEPDAVLDHSELSTFPTSPDLRILQITIPVVGAIIIVVIIIIALALRRRRNVYSRTPKLDSPVAFLHKQDNVSLLENMTVVSKNPTYSTHDLDDALLVELREKHVRKDKLRLMGEIGEGAFGKVFKGEMQISDERSNPVAVKILKSDASRETRDDFRREVKIMSSFDHENILKLIGIVPTLSFPGEDSPYMIFEYMEHGDLTELLRKNDPCLGSKYHIRLRQADLIDISTQIANGMVYLASHHFVHRDLATRNCLVGTGLVVKISDFGMSRDIYTCDYYKIGGARMLPVRWMSPESMKYGKFTMESDVWAFGVVLWEIFSFGKQPHYGHGNEEVIKFIEDGILLQKPNGCPETLYHIMLGCWRRDARERFSFVRIHNLLLEYQRNVIKYARHMSMQRVAEPEEV